ncbi:MAG: peptidylprolyl isomerase, partial [Oceanospirillaceae bacterium]|nr:peptidylprolyl isomerase [Oceanospirillaceae bacterium]
MTIFNTHPWFRSMILAACVIPVTAQAGLLGDWQGKPGVSVVATMLDQEVTWSELRLAAANASEAGRKALSEDSEVFAAYVNKIALRKHIIKLAQETKLDDTAVVEFAVRQAYDKAMIDQWLNLATQPEPGFPSQAEVDTAYQDNQTQFVAPARVNLSQLFLLHSDDKQADAARLAQVLEEIKANPDGFAELSKVHSDHAESAVNGGSLGWLQIDQLQPEIFKAISNLTVGSISTPVVTDTGSHFILVNGIVPARVRPLEEVQ